jgi:hypothetical protein
VGFVSLNEPPPRAVTHAFGITEPLRPLAGGQGTSWVAGDLVLKPDAGPRQEWLASALARMVVDGFRVGMPVASRYGAWHHQGWSATRWIDGSEPDYSAVSTWQAILTAGQAFHRAAALCWHDAHSSLPNDVNVSAAAVARGLLFRMTTTNERFAAGIDVPNLHEEADRYALAATAIGV